VLPTSQNFDRQKNPAENNSRIVPTKTENEKAVPKSYDVKMTMLEKNILPLSDAPNKGSFMFLY
jgi:hypothetical protein